MKSIVRFVVLFALLMATGYSCKYFDSKKEENLLPGVRKVTAVAVEEAPSYTYIMVRENKEEYWIATDQTGIKVGEDYYYMESMKMENFFSKELNKTFDVIYFADVVSQEPITKDYMLEKKSPHNTQPKLAKEEFDVTPAEGGISIFQLYGDLAANEGKTVKIRGIVTKFNTGIMDKNWAHIQDGTANGDDFDLTVTTLDMMNIGDTVIFEGVMSLNKDFGAGYTYKAIMEDAKVVGK